MRYRIAGVLLLTSAAAMAEEAPSAPSADTATIPVPQDAGGVPPPVPEAAPAGTQLDDVVVTAERKVSTVQETPISIEAFNSEKLALRGIDGLFGLAYNVPSMTVDPFPTHNATLRIFIRGVGVNDAQVTQDPAVGVYIDGVYIARSVGLALDIADLERIEVLRGPQGTLYGRNTTGGAVNLVTRRPQPGVFSMQHQLTFADRNQYFGRSSVNIPVGDDLAFKVALLGNVRDGYLQNDGPGGDFGDRREGAVRVDARWLPTDWLTVDYGFDRTKTRYWNYQFQATLPPDTNHGQAELFKPYAQSQTVYSTHRLDSLATGMPMARSGTDIRGHALTLTAPLGDYELKYLGAWRKLLDDQYADLGGGAGSLGYRLDTQSYDGPSALMLNGGQPVPLQIPQVFQSQWSHELQFSGKLFDEQLSFIAGAFHFSEDGGENGRPLHHILNSLLDPASVNGVDLPGLPEALVDLVAPRIVAYWDYYYRIHNTADALFGQITWSPGFLDRRAHLTLGVRKSRDERRAVKDYASRQFVEGQLAGAGLIARELPASQGNDTFVDVHAVRKYDDFSPSANLQYELGDHATTYVSYARAYKSGGFNVRDPQISGASGPASDRTNYGFGFTEGFKPERVQSYELGVKSEWFGRRLRLNADVFHSQYRDMQTNFLIVGTVSDTKSRNAGKARMSGAEVDTAFVAAPGLILALDYAYLDAKVSEVIDHDGNNIAHLFPFINAPPHSYVASVDWTFLERGWGALRAFASYNYVGYREGLVITEERRGKTAIDAYGLFNARLVAGGIRFGEHGSLDVALWGRNLADKEYPITAIDNLPQADRAVIWGEPRSVGLDLVYRYF